MRVHKVIFINIWTQKKDVSSWMKRFGLVQKDTLPFLQRNVMF